MSDFFTGLPLFHSQIRGIARIAAFQGRMNLAIVGDPFACHYMDVLKNEFENLQTPYIAYSMNNPLFKIQSFMDGTLKDAVAANKVVVIKNCHDIFGANDPRGFKLLEMLGMKHDLITTWASIPSSSLAKLAFCRIHNVICGPQTEKVERELKARHGYTH